MEFSISLVIGQAAAPVKDYPALGATEFQARERVPTIGARALETVANQRQNSGPRGRA